jgi:hypothetical protein
MFHIVVWLFFLLVYSQAVRQPLERSTQQRAFDEWEVIMYTMALAFLCEDINRVSTRWGFCEFALIDSSRSALQTAQIRHLQGVQFLDDR